MVENWDEWCDAITEKSDGRITFTTYYSCTLLDSSAEMQQLMAGVADIADAKRLASDGFNISEKLEASDCRSSIRWSGLFIL